MLFDPSGFRLVVSAMGPIRDSRMIALIPGSRMISCRKDGAGLLKYTSGKSEVQMPDDRFPSKNLVQVPSAEHLNRFKLRRERLHCIGSIHSELTNPAVADDRNTKEMSQAGRRACQLHGPSKPRRNNSSRVGGTDMTCCGQGCCVTKGP